LNIIVVFVKRWIGIGKPAFGLGIGVEVMMRSIIGLGGDIADTETRLMVDIFWNKIWWVWGLLMKLVRIKTWVGTRGVVI